MKVNALLFDIRSVQSYIFSGNRLRTNIGASHITSHLFQNVLVDGILKNEAERGNIGTLDASSWRSITGKFDALPDGCDTFVAQVGGGKALILFRKTDDAAADRAKLRRIVTLFGREVLERFPGLHTGAAIGEIDLACFMESEDGLFKILKNNQNTVYPTVNVPYTGLTLSCDVNGEAANHYDLSHVIDTGNRRTSRWFSQEVYAKASMADAANDEMNEEYAAERRGRTFPKELDELGQREGEDYIAIIHIDGNKMGVRFRQCQKLSPEEQFAQYNKLALTVQTNTKKAFRSLLNHIDENFERYTELGSLDLRQGNGKERLPIRPLIFGGDDVSFVCAAKVALELATHYMRSLIAPEDASNRLYTCAGIAILPTSYPFFRGYQLAEQLCGAAKNKSRAYDNSCWLDFAILHGEQAPTLAEIRRQEYRGILGNMHFGPYRVDDDGDHFSIRHLTDCIGALRRTCFPQNKLKEMRSAIARDEHEVHRFMEELTRQGRLKMPHIDAWSCYEENLWDASHGGGRRLTPYADVIEMMDYTVPNAATTEAGECDD